MQAPHTGLPLVQVLYDHVVEGAVLPTGFGEELAQFRQDLKIASQKNSDAQLQAFRDRKEAEAEAAEDDNEGATDGKGKGKGKGAKGRKGGNAGNKQGKVAFDETILVCELPQPRTKRKS